MSNTTDTITPSMQSFKRYLAKLSGKLDLRIILMIPFVIQILLTIGLVGYLSFRDGQNITNDVVQQLHDEITSHIQHQIDSNLASNSLDFVLEQKGLSVQLTPYREQPGANSWIALAVPITQVASYDRIVLFVFLLANGITAAMAFLAYSRISKPMKEEQMASQMLAKEKLAQQEGASHDRSTINSYAALPAPAHLVTNSSSPAPVSPLISSAPPAPYVGMIESDQYYSFLKNKSNNSFHILVAADESVSLQALTDHLTSHHYQVTQATTSQEALELIDSRQNFDLVLLDFTMPESSNIEICREIRQTHSANHLPIIILTTSNQENNLLEAFKVGANDYMTKPCAKEALLSRIKSHTRLARVTNVYHRFVPHEFLRTLGKKNVTEIKLGDQVRRNMSVLFADIRSFGFLSKQMSAEENFKFLNAYLGRITPVIREYNGFIDKYMGDSTMALFAGPASDAIEGAIAMQRSIRHYNTHRAKSDYQPITVGIGLHYGEVVIGTIGENGRFESTVISPVVNLAARLEKLSKLYGAQILVSQQTIDALKEPERYHFRFLDKIKVRHKPYSIKVFEVLEGESEEIMEQKVQTLDEFNRALAYYYQKEFKKAKAGFEQVLSINPMDNAARLYLHRLLRW